MNTIFSQYDWKLKEMLNSLPLEFMMINRQNADARISEITYFKKVFQTGISLFIEENSEKDKTPMLLVPIKNGDQVEAILRLTPFLDHSEWFYLNRGIITNLAEIGCKWISSQKELKRLERENDLFRRELHELFSMTDDFILVISPNGTIEGVNETFASKLQSRKHVLEGEEVTQVLSKESWDRIKFLHNKTWMEIELNHSLLKCHKLSALVKPILIDGAIQSFLIKIVEKRFIKKDKPAHSLYRFEKIMGTSEKLLDVINIAKRVSTSDVTILLRGESGTGKEMFAQSIHMHSLRAEKPFIALNCAAIPENLLESELFGHVKGAFTGAVADKPGRFEMANGGTIFLDEIGDMSLHLQAKLLRVVQERKIERVGDRDSRSVDVRIITATHKNLEQLVADGLFREDLFYRLNVIPLYLPQLRERKEDIPLLIEYFMKKLSKDLNRPAKRLSNDVLQTLMNHHWPGNIRELYNVVQHFIELEIGEIVTIKSLPSGFLSNDNKEVSKENRSAPKERIEKDHMILLLDHYGRDTNGKKKIAAKLGISLPTLYRKLGKLRIK